MQYKKLQEKAWETACLRKQIDFTKGTTFENGINTIKHLSGECIELTEAFVNYNKDMSEENKKELESEIADVFICVSTLSKLLEFHTGKEFNLEKIIQEKLEYNSKRVNLEN